MSNTKLDWNYDQSHDCEVAFHNGYMIKAERDDGPMNPLEEWDGNWPTLVYSGRREGFTSYDKVKGVAIDAPLDRFTDGQLVHDQKALSALLGVTTEDFRYLTEELGIAADAEIPKWITAPNALRHVFEDAIGNVDDNTRLDTFAELYALLNIPHYRTTSCGYNQGDWAELLVVATPEAIEEFGHKGVPEKNLEATADLYTAWAWGDVYGWTLHAPEYDEDGEVEDWTQLDDSCWGYYGVDHAASGLEEAALAALPEEPVRLPDALLLESV